MEKHLPGQHDQKKHGKSTRTPEEAWAGFPEAKLSWPEFANKYKDIMLMTGFERASGTFGAHIYADFLSHVYVGGQDLNYHGYIWRAVDDPNTPKVLSRLSLSSARFDKDETFERLVRFPYLQDQLKDFYRKLEDVAKDAGVRTIASNLKSMPVVLAGALGYVASDYTNNQYNIFNQSMEFLNKEYGLEKADTNNLKTVDGKSISRGFWHLPIKTLLDIRHPLYPDVSLVSEFLMTSTKKLNTEYDLHPENTTLEFTKDV